MRVEIFVDQLFKPKNLTITKNIRQFAELRDTDRYCEVFKGRKQSYCVSSIYPTKPIQLSFSCAML